MANEIQDAQYAQRIFERMMTLLFRHCKFKIKGGENPDDPVRVDDGLAAFDEVKLLVSGELWKIPSKVELGMYDIFLVPDLCVGSHVVR